MKEILTHICFDLDDTLYEQLAPFQHALNQLHPVAQEKLRDIYKSFRSRSNEMFSCIRTRRFHLNACILNASS